MGLQENLEKNSILSNLQPQCTTLKWVSLQYWQTVAQSTEAIIGSNMKTNDECLSIHCFFQVNLD